MAQNIKHQGNYRKKWDTETVKQYCKDNNITLLEISYKEFNVIDDILNNILLCGEVVA